MFGFMNRLSTITALLLLMAPFLCLSQNGAGYLFVKKGIKKKRTYIGGDPIHIKLQSGHHLAGTITLLRNDTIFIDGFPVHKTFVKEVILKRKPRKPFPDAKTVALIAAGSALTSFGLALNNNTNREEALIAGPVIGFGPLLIKHFGGRAIRAIPRKKFRVGRRFYLQVLDFHFPPGYQLKSF